MDGNTWFRFLDDILLLWTGTNLELNTFLQHLNSRMRAIKFTMEKSQSTITFLVLEIYKGHRFNSTGVLDIKPYKKPTNPQYSSITNPIIQDPLSPQSSKEKSLEPLDLPLTLRHTLSLCPHSWKDSKREATLNLCCWTCQASSPMETDPTTSPPSQRVLHYHLLC